MTRFFLDTEFNGWQGVILSLALVREDGASLYLIQPDEYIASLRDRGQLNPWVEENVVPILRHVPEHVQYKVTGELNWPELVGDFLWPEGRESDRVQVLCDWPDDMRYLIETIITGPHVAVPMGHQTDLSILRHIPVYPTDLEGCIRHNAWWDAMALRRYVEITG